MVSFFFTLSSLFLLFSLCIHVSSAADTISANFTLSGDQTIVSSGEIFELGFEKLGTSPNFYICMWYKQLTDFERTIVWVANRDKPVSDKNSAVLRISNGNLILLDGKNQTPIWSTGLNSTSSSASYLEAVLLDDGNLVLRDGGGSGSSATVLWQSFDHPGNTWLPGVKIRFDKRTNKSQQLTSWKNLEDPSPGLFSLELDQTTAYKILWNGTNQYWSSGPWNAQSQLFDWVPEMRLNFIYNFSFVSNSTESYFTYSVYNHLNVSRFVMDVSGQIKMLSWFDNNKQWNVFWSQPRQQCEVYAYCGSFGICNDKSQPFCQCPHGFRPASQKDWDLNDYSAGCVRKTELQCSRGDINQFLPLSNMKLDENAEELTITSPNICKSTCQGNCSCKAYAHEEGSNKCLIWTKDVLYLQQLDEDNSEGNTFYLRLAASDMPNGSSSKSSKVIIFGAVLGSLGVIVFVLLAVILILRYQRRKRMGGQKGDGTLAAFSYRELQNATKNFSEKLGGGGFGSVFKGGLPDSSDVAVKRLESISQGEKQFRTEVVTIGTIQHVNLVRLRGFCSEGNKKLLVYDYMPNGSLDSHLFIDQTEEKIALGWKLRYQIALGTARGLAYLHDECRDCIIHCDIKPENILLDSQFCPKVADFGLAKLVGRDFSRVLTTMRGTRGYLAPEWITGVAITAKADVYSYGMMLFELVSGRRNTEQSENGKVRFFPSWAATVLTKDGDIRSLLDPKLEDGEEAVNIEELTRACKVACWCIQDEEGHRPAMSQVVQILEGILEVNPPPFPRSIQALVETDEAMVFFTESSSSSSHSSSQKQSQSSSSSSSSKKTTNNNSSA